MICRKLQPFERTTFLPYFMTAWCVFIYQSVVFFLPMVFIMFLITTLCFYDFCKTVLVKKYTPCQGIIWFSLPNDISVILAFMWYFNYTIKAHSASEQHEKTARGCCPRTPTGVYMHRTLRTHVLKNWPPSQPCLLHVLPQNLINFKRLFNMSNTNTHFDIFLKN